MASVNHPTAHGRDVGTDTSSSARAAQMGRSALTGETARYLGAISLVVVGVIHAQQYYYDYFSVVPTIGTLFVLSFVGSGFTAAVLIAPVRRLGRNRGDLILALAALSGIGIAAGSLVSLMYSEYLPLFGFMESGYRLAIKLTLIFDSLTTVLLGVFILSVVRSRRQAAATAAVSSDDVM
jgi:hypothetical protein